jgi:EAL domain-containing protein (putative c-di-GMP-specific phosphodiesterase class I)
VPISGRRGAQCCPVNLVDDLARALAHGEIVPYFQPQLELNSGRVVAGEALARWQHPERGLLEPESFIQAAEDHGLIDELGIFMVDEAWKYAASWIGRGLPVQVSVNASATQLESTGLTDHIARLFDRYDLPAQTLTIEITETKAFVDAVGVSSRLRVLRERGLGISVDDFGAGYSTQERLDEVPATELKIDVTLVQDETDDGYRELIRIVELAHERGLRVVAEGVEDESQRRRVEILRCQRAQGYLLGRPMPAAEFGDLLAARR